MSGSVIIRPNSALQAQALMDFIAGFLSSSAFDAGLISEFIFNAMFNYSQQIKDMTPAQIQNCPYKAEEWIAVAIRLNQTISQHARKGVLNG